MYPWICIIYPWIFIYIRGYLDISMDIYYISMDIYIYLLIFITSVASFLFPSHKRSGFELPTHLIGFG